jgi:chromatin segregation and condensation protein Rec8/ScpA/Scc1 (kleisin family)
MIVTFIALLELIKLGQVTVIQSQNFADIMLLARPREGSDTHASDQPASGD